jgi:hypothetical protein
MVSRTRKMTAGGQRNTASPWRRLQHAAGGAFPIAASGVYIRGAIRDLQIATLRQESSLDSSQDFRARSLQETPAADLGVSRHEVRATVMGEHGGAMIPLWCSVELLTDDPRAVDRLARLRTRSAVSPLEVRVPHCARM